MERVISPCKFSSTGLTASLISGLSRLIPSLSFSASSKPILNLSLKATVILFPPIAKLLIQKSLPFRISRSVDSAPIFNTAVSLLSSKLRLNLTQLYTLKVFTSKTEGRNLISSTNILLLVSLSFFIATRRTWYGEDSCSLPWGVSNKWASHSTSSREKGICCCASYLMVFSRFSALTGKISKNFTNTDCPLMPKIISLVLIWFLARRLATFLLII